MIVPVLKTSLVILKKDRAEVLRVLQKHGLIMIDKEEENLKVDTQYEDNLYLRVQNAIKHLKDHNGKSKAFGYQEVSYDTFTMDKTSRIDLLTKVEEITQKLESLDHQNKSLKEEVKLYDAFKHLAHSTMDVKKAKYTTFKYGYVTPKNQPKLVEYLDENNIPYEFYGTSELGLALCYVTLNQNVSNTLENTRGLGFEVVELPLDDLPFNEYVLKLETTVSNNLVEIENLNKELEELSNSALELRILADQLLSEKEAKLVQFNETEKTLFITGWTREDQKDKLEKVLKKSNLDYEIDFRKPREDEVPPTAMKNNKFVAPFETITNMFSIPSHKDIDPNPVMSIWFWLIFGIAMGDIGYGLILLIGGFLFLKLKRPKGQMKNLMTVFTLSGITSIVAGVLFDSFFGVPIFAAMGLPQVQITNIMERPLELLVFSLGLGVLHIISGQILKTIQSFRLKDPLTGLADGLSWIFVLLGLVFAFGQSLLNMFFPGKFAPSETTKILGYIGYGFLGLGLLMIILLAGRDQKNPIKKVTAALGGLYGIVNYLSDILSYSRILALSLSTAVIGYAMNLLGSMVGPAFGGFGWIFAVVIFIVGHVFNFAMGLLSAYVHDSRLQYIEFFGKFYEGNGYLFEPFSLKLENVNEVINND